MDDALKGNLLAKKIMVDLSQHDGFSSHRKSKSGAINQNMRKTVIER